MMCRYRLLSASLLLVLFLAGCQSSFISNPTSAPKIVVKTVIGEGRSLEGALSINGDCVRVQGQALAWLRTTNARVQGDVFRFQNPNGEIVLLHEGDWVRLYGGCEIREAGVCVTPTLEEAQAVSSCDDGPYFITYRIRPLTPPLTPPPSP